MKLKNKILVIRKWKPNKKKKTEIEKIEEIRNRIWKTRRRANIARKKQRSM